MGMGGETGHAWSVVIPHNFSSWLVSPVASVELGCLRLYHGHLTWPLGCRPEMDRNEGSYSARSLPGEPLDNFMH